METAPQRLAHILSGRHAALIATQGDEVRREKKERICARTKQRMVVDPVFRAMVNCRRRFTVALKSAKTPKPALRSFGYSPAQLKAHLESLFTEGMTWQNYGEWEIDHIRPCRTFDLRHEGARMACFSLSNLQPLWKAKNRQKSGCYMGLKPGIRLTIDGSARVD